MAVALRTERPAIEAHAQKIETTFPAPGSDELPVQRTVELERLYRKQRLAAGYRLFARHGFEMGGAGHITARDPEWTDHFWVNPFGVHFSRITVSDLMLVSDRGEIVLPPARAKARLNQAAFAIHSELHKARPDVVAAAHSHSLYGKAWSALGRPLEPLTQDSAAFFEDHAVFEEFSGVVLDTSEGEKIATALGPRKAVILQNHGILTVGRSVEAAVWRYLALENACQVQLLAQAAGPTRPMPDAVARHTAAQVGNEIGNFFAFQPYWDMVTAEEPDLFD
ncbi:ribulose-5-phosphate 4-epimerase/fuculose-1-phosphate aldolase [Stella humosa]|uniref:Ribulose-5-phosphate 4-epimerase/fuculose-1-phosphate aldolase n=1 Tax=Stella humosa TaxID=94 RepID=A0A3N1KPZ9_9PROT|nr:class II aldolase/adducin family protein [Stella humosa]ROP81367.1 ribulose-5-phosphate 4-epimerase/fuculose-1-phosphate aldolase [Stella humosa]BBK32718.1 class II aldolase/adducin family protein [Stella humosa]